MGYCNDTLCISRPEPIPGIMSEYGLKVLRRCGSVPPVRRACPDTRFPRILPERPRCPQEKCRACLRGGCAVFITGMYGTCSAAKVDDDSKESLLARLLADARNLDNAQIAAFYSTAARGSGWKDARRLCGGDMAQEP